MNSALSEIGLSKNLDNLDCDPGEGSELSVSEEMKGERDIYSNMKSRQKQLEFLEIQEEYVRNDIKNLRGEILRAQEEVKRGPVRSISHRAVLRDRLTKISA